MKLKDFIEAFSGLTKFTITESAFFKDNGEYYSFRTVYNSIEKTDLRDDIEEVEVFSENVFAVYVHNDVVYVDVETFIDRQEEE